MVTSSDETLRMNVFWNPTDFSYGVAVEHATGEIAGDVWLCAMGATGDPGDARRACEDILLAWSQHGRLGLAAHCSGRNPWRIMENSPLRAPRTACEHCGGTGDRRVDLDVSTEE